MKKDRKSWYSVVLGEKADGDNFKHTGERRPVKQNEYFTTLDKKGPVFYADVPKDSLGYSYHILEKIDSGWLYEKPKRERDNI